MNNIILMIKGFFMGIANIIPGVSGGTIALILGIYENFIHAISHFFRDWKKNLAFLIPVVIGILVAIVSMSGVISYSYEHYPIATTLFFMGLVFGGMPFLLHKVQGKKEAKKFSSFVLMTLTFAIVILLSCSDLLFDTEGKVILTNLSVGGYVLLFLVGMLAAGTMVVPGVSGSLVLMLLGYYYPILEVIKSLAKFQNLGNNLCIAGVFGVGILVGIILIAKLLEYLFQKHEIKTYCAVIGFIAASFFAIPISTAIELGTFTFGFVEVIIGVALFVIGALVSYKLGEK